MPTLHRTVVTDEKLERILTAAPEVRTRDLATETGLNKSRVSQLRRRQEKCAVIMASKLGLLS